MPNNVVNILTANGSKEVVKKFYQSIKGDHELIDFNCIIPMPEQVKYGDNDYCEWARENWGTKWNAYESERIDDYTIRFETAWSGIPELIGTLSENWPELVFDYMFADEDYSYNTGSGWIQNGILNMYYPDGDSEDGWDIYFQTHEGMREQFEYKNGTYELI